MNTSEWTAVISVCLTIVGSAVAFAFWLGGRHKDILVSFAQLQTEIKMVENDWHDKLADTEKELRKEIQHGPPWLKTLLEKQEQLMEILTKNAQIAIKVAEQHGEELNDVRRTMYEHGQKLDLLVEAIKNRGGEA